MIPGKLPKLRRAIAFLVLASVAFGIGHLYQTGEQYIANNQHQATAGMATTEAINSLWCDIRSIFFTPCSTPEPEKDYAYVETTENQNTNTKEQNTNTKDETTNTTNQTSTTTNYITNQYTTRPVERETVREVIIQEGTVDTSNFITREEYSRQVDALLRSTESNQESSGLSDITSESLEDLQDVATMSQTTGDLFTWNGTTWTNTATSSLGIGGAVDSVNGSTGTVVLDTDDVTEGSTNLYFTNTRADNRIASATTTIRSMLSESITGIDYASGDFSLTSGYTIPQTASTTQWATAFGWGDHATQNYAVTDTAVTFTNATTTNLVVTGNATVSGTLSTNLNDGCVEIAGGALTSTGSNCGTGSGGITNLNGLTSSSQSFATATSSGLTLDVSSAGGVHTFTAGLDAGYTIPLTASTTNWNTAYLWGDHGAQGYLTDISGQSLETLSDVASFTQSDGDLLYWNGGAWSNIATSSLGISGNPFDQDLNTTNDVTFNTLSVTSGTSTFVGSLVMTGSILPSADIIYDLGSPDKQWKDVYIGPGSLYINGKKVIQDVSDTITISTDLNQNLAMQTSGVGTILLAATSTGSLALESNSGNINLNSISGNVNLGTTGSGNLNLGTIDSGTWNGTVIDISDYTNLTVGATGLELSGDSLALAAGYTIPFSASTTNWQTAFGWGDHSVQGYLTDLTGQSLETLSDVASMTQSTGDLLSWNGSVWTNVATSSLGITGSGSSSTGVASSSVAFSVNKNGTDQTVTTSTWTKLTWSTELFDTNNNFDIDTNERFTPTVAGKYAINLQAYCSGAAMTCAVAVYKNGSAIHTNYAETNGNLMPAVSTIVEMNGTTDYLEAYVIDSGATTISGGTEYTYFTGALIAPSNGLAGGWSNDETQSYLADYTDLVAIGTTTAAAKLDVWGESGSTNDLFGISSSTGSRLLTVSASGKVGIGTSTPQAKLSVVSDSYYTALFTASDGDSNIYVGDGHGVNRLRLGYNSSTNIGIINSHDGSTFQRLDIDGSSLIINAISGGKVGIGTTTPSTLLHIEGNTGVGLRIKDNAVAGADWVISPQTANSTNLFRIIQYNEAGDPSFDRLVIDGSGNVGIGSINPSSKLYVEDSKTAGFVQTIRNTGNSTSGQGLSISAGSNSSGGAYFISFYRPDGAHVGGIVQNGASNVSYNTSSDRRVKDDIDYTKLGLDELMQLPVRVFSFNSDPTHATTTGFIAQELYEVFPWAVTTNGDNGTDPLTEGLSPWAVDYGRITPLLVKSIQDLNLKLEDLASSTAATSTLNALGEEEPTFVGRFFARLVEWFADAGNGIGKLFAEEVYTKKICVEDEDGTSCYSRSELDAAVGAAGGYGGTQTSDNADNGDETNKDETKPTITLIGTTEIILELGDAYEELGANATSSDGTALTIDDGIEIDSSAVDTNATGTYEVIYTATDGQDNTASTTRTVIVTDPNASDQNTGGGSDGGAGGGEAAAPIPGCTDETATNYDPDATQDDDSCTYSGPDPQNPALESEQEEDSEDPQDDPEEEPAGPTT